ncbi:MAG: hypothetical protein WCG47_23605 [Dermatophilaceae bacterium]
MSTPESAMRILFRILAAIVLVTGVTYFAGSAATAASADPSGPPGDPLTVQVVGDGSHVSIDRARVPAGQVRFDVSSTNPTPGSGSQITLLRLQPGVSFKQFNADLAHEFAHDSATAAKGTRELTRDARFFGLADVAPGTPATVTENLSPGTYYLFDSGNNTSTGAPAKTRLTVVRDQHNGDGPDDAAAAALADDNGRMASVRLTSADTFVVRGQLPARGSVRVTNVSDTLHFMSMERVKPGTTDADVQAFFDSQTQGPPPFGVDGPSVGADVQSPGRSLTLSYDLPPGTYVLLCFVADDKTGMPHAFMGMHKVVTLK